MCRARQASSCGTCGKWIESLERRRLLAGNVTASYDPATDTLTLIGDNRANEITVVGFGGGHVLTPAPGTTVNGSSGVAILGGGRSNLHVDLGNGDDTLILGPQADDERQVDVATGNGADNVSILNVGSSANLNVDTGNGDDHLTMASVVVTGGMNIDTGNGADTVSLHDVGSNNADLIVRLGSGADSLTAAGFVSAISANILIDGGSGFDVLTGSSSVNSVFGTETIENFETVT